MSQRLTWEPLRSIDSATLISAVTYYPVGTPLAYPSYICKMVNNSSVLVTISINGTSDIDVAPGNSFWLYDESKVGRDGQIPAIPKGTQFFVKAAAAGVGSIYLVSQYIVS